MSSKVKSKIRTGDNSIDHEGGSGDSHYSDHGFLDAALSDHREDAASSGASSPRGDVHPSSFGKFSHATCEELSPGNNSRGSGDESEGKSGISKIITAKAGALIGKTGLPWPWKGNDREGSESKAARFVWPWLHNDLENDLDQQKTSAVPAKLDNQESNRMANNEASGSWSSSFNINSTSSASSCGSTSSSAVNKVDMDTDCLDYEILWEDLTIGEQVGQGIHFYNYRSLHVYYFLFIFAH